MALSSVIHLVTAAIAAGPILLLWQVRLWWTWPVAALGVGVWLVARPRLLSNLRRPEADTPVLTRDAAPRLFALLDRCADTLHAPRVGKVLLTGEFAAGTARLTARRTVYLFLGIPLWTATPRSARLALLGHQAAHQASHDVTNGWWADGARRSLAGWIRLSDPRGFYSQEVNWSKRIRPWNPDPLDARIRLPMELGYQVQRSRVAPNSAMMIATRIVSVLLFGPLWLLAQGFARIFARLRLRCREPAEYFADQAAARLGSTEAALALLDTLALRPPAWQFLRRPAATAAEKHAVEGTWRRLREYLDSVPEHERLRLARLEELGETSIEQGHPPHYLRRALLAERPPLPGELIVDQTEWDAIDAELKPHIEKATGDVLRRMRG